ncbi:hypothetical protein BvCmsKSP026_05073 [Escherichia coli]|nr:hypothetical protein BvCmsKKP062_01581 [Escherichia coli]GDK34085.1 hypothetical protein BvCmsKSP026_05073 [Escherichia coli]GDL13002.1 hypothetical protein BvCmsKSP002_03340 [Escherichia coli]GDL79511.1 hypothetical protein BvCmsKSP007_03075 [Escherichia coli]GDP55517.1 hypothetical protein BvCmsNSP070_01363 [Escherichia coli]
MTGPEPNFQQMSKAVDGAFSGDTRTHSASITSEANLINASQRWSDVNSVKRVVASVFTGSGIASGICLTGLPSFLAIATRNSSLFSINYPSFLCRLNQLRKLSPSGDGRSLASVHSFIAPTLIGVFPFLMNRRAVLAPATIPTFHNAGWLFM